MEKRFRITAACNPYHARFHYNGGEVLRYDGATPVQWVHLENLTYMQAKDEFQRWAYEECAHWDDDKIAESLQAIREDEDTADCTIDDWKADNRWYDGPGWYHCGSYEKCWDGGDTYSDDVMTYHIVEEER